MRTVIWFILLFTAAVVAATTFGQNDGLVSLFWAGWRVDLSLNLAVLGLLGAVFVLYTAITALHALVAMPTRAREWRELKRERGAQAALREALAEHFAARYGRAHKAAQRALDLQADVPALQADREFSGLAHLIAGAALHRIQDRRRRDERAARVHELLPPGLTGASPVLEGAQLMSAEWALEDRDAERGLEALRALPPGLARRTQALRLKLQAARLAQQPVEALQTARLLANHQGFSPLAARSLLRSLAMEVLSSSQDADALQRHWASLDGADRKDVMVGVRAAQRAVAFDRADLARQYLLPHWAELGRLDADERQALAGVLIDAVKGIGSDWLPRVESALAQFGHEASVVAAAGVVFAERQLWGKARKPLEQTARAAILAGRVRRQALRRLAFIARLEGDEERGGSFEREAAAIE